MSFHEQLLRATEPARQDLLSIPILGRAAAGAVTLDDYRAFLGQAYHHVRHTTPLLMACGARIPTRLEWLRDAVAEYIEEELGHQEWILDDLAHTGLAREDILAIRPWAETELMVAYAYDTITRGNPVSFFGMVLVLEGTSIALATRAAQALQAGLGLPKQAFRYLLSHGDLDQAHMGFYEGLMNRLQDPQDRQAVIHAANVIYPLYGAVLSDARAESRLARAA